MIIETFGITKVFKALVAVDHINLSVEEGEIFGLLGPNGAGTVVQISLVEIATSVLIYLGISTLSYHSLPFLFKK